MNLRRRNSSGNGKLAGYVGKWEASATLWFPKDSQAMIRDWVMEKGLFANEQRELIILLLYLDFCSYKDSIPA